MNLFEIIKFPYRVFHKAYLNNRKKKMGVWNFFLWQGKKAEEKIQREYYKQTFYTVKSEKTTVIYMANGFTWHGGLADRLKGIISLFCWCHDNNRPFKINFCHPFRLQDYLIPNQYDWLIGDDEISYNLQEARVLQCLLEPVLAVPEVQSKMQQLQESWMNDNLQLRNKQLHVYTNMRCGNHRFAELFPILFKPAPRLQQLIEYHLERIGGTYISISFRFTTLLGDFNDCTGPALPEQERQPLIDKCLKAISDISSIAPRHDRVLLTADSCTFLRQAAKLPNVYVIPGKVGHIDYENNDDVNMKTFLDFLLISKAEAVYLGKSGKMYKSAFAQTASMVNNRPFNIIEF